MKKFLFVFVVAVMSLAFAGTAHAAISFITSSGGLGGNDFIDWGSVGAVTYTDLLNPFIVTSNGGITLSVSDPSASSFQRRDQGNGWAGNFANGDKLLWTNGSSGPIILDFPTLIKGAGAQIQSDFFGSFTGVIQALDAGGGVLATFSLPGGDSNSNGDNSAIFIGVLSDSFNIDKISFDVLKPNSAADFAINQVDLVTTGKSVVPEPATLSLLGLGLSGLLLRRKRIA